MTWVAGVDGCKGGWLLVRWNGHDKWEGRIFPSFRDILTTKSFEICAIDIPIGLLEAGRPGGRTCDQAARKLLGRPRSSSVFSPPARRALCATTYEEAKNLNQPAGLSIQAYGILSKIREIDEVMTPECQQTIFEAHPEVSFMAAAGRPMLYSKKKRDGRQERLQVLETTAPGFGKIYEKIRKDYYRKDVALDDIIDAGILCWTAQRIMKDEARRLPEKTYPEIDDKGLRMEILY